MSTVALPIYIYIYVHVSIYVYTHTYIPLRVPRTPLKGLRVHTRGPILLGLDYGCGGPSYGVLRFGHGCSEFGASPSPTRANNEP